jgi:hypothetical protein
MAGSVHHDNGPHPVCLCTGQRLDQSGPLRIGRCLFPEARAQSRGQAVIVGAAFLALVLAPVICRAANMWLPAEKIVLRGQPAVVGYVLAADPRYATVLRAADATVQILQLDDVESRTICRLNPGLESASLVRYLAGSASKRTPRASPYALTIRAVPGARASGHSGEHAPADTEGQRACGAPGSGWSHAGCEGLARTVRSSVRC